MNFFVLIALVMILRVYKKPWVLALFYSVFGGAWALLTLSKIDSEDIVATLIAMVILYITSFIYFWLLNKFEETFWYWLILVIGLSIGLI